MRIFIACLDQESLWAMDDMIAGLYLIDLRKFEIKCVIDCQKLFPHGRFNVLSLFTWKKDYVVIVPMEVDRKWIIYNKITGETEYRKVIEQKCQEILITVDSERNQLYFFPLYRYDPILIINLDTLTCSQMIENWSSKVSDKYLKTASKGAYNGQHLFFPIKDTNILVRMDCGSRKVDLLKLDIPENIIGVDCAFEELWILPVSGNRLYQIDENGSIVNTVELIIENDADLLFNFARVIVQKRYLFLLPYYRKGIYVYDKQDGKTQIIPEESTSLERNDKEVYLRYWEYCVRDNQICFLPYRDNYIEIDLDTLVYRKKDLSYPLTGSDEENVWKNIWCQVSAQNSISETDEYTPNVLSRYIQNRTNTKCFSLGGYVGNRVWDMVKN